ncbi:DUF2244 domain-containing protein [Salinimonas marina]|uniref:DUF2244 domain-containing protein n=1 Tax=Salinimonas marina TaxID=2785918 RepID=A0A7S9DZ77_9ALTE|nr:DUF2244 domain-containing protein [Salinimonas marina]QPG06638.1 DUF2244 domain-containing protein [Salinimonas marina]
MSPNRSASWDEIKLVLLGFAVVIFSIAIAWTMAGVWIVLPFAGAELALLGYLMYRANWQAYQHQRLIITPVWLVLEQGYRHQKVVKLIRAECQIMVTETEGHWQLPLYVIYCGGKEYPVGTFLNLSDLKQLQYCLHQCGLGLCRNRWWES